MIVKMLVLPLFYTELKDIVREYYAVVMNDYNSPYLIDNKNFKFLTCCGNSWTFQDGTIIYSGSREGFTSRLSALGVWKNGRQIVISEHEIPVEILEVTSSADGIVPEARDPFFPGWKISEIIQTFEIEERIQEAFIDLECKKRYNVPVPVPL